MISAEAITQPIVVTLKEKEIIKKYLGVPWKEKGRSLEGLDCYGLMVMIYADFGFKLLDWEEENKDYDEKWYLKENILEENYWKQWEKIEEPAPLDVVLLSGIEGMAYHAGIVLTSRRFIHTCKAGTVVSRLDDRRWKSRIQGFYRFKGFYKCSK